VSEAASERSDREDFESALEIRRRGFTLD